MARIKLNHPRRERAGYVANSASMLTVKTEGGRVTLTRRARRANGARGEALKGVATIMAGGGRAIKRVTGGRTR